MALGSALGRAISAATGGRSPFDDYWYQPFPVASSSGPYISADSALSTSPVWACVRLLADPVAALPLWVYRRRADGGKDRARDYWLTDLLRWEPNEIQTAFTWKRVSMVHALLWGNAYSQIVRGGRGMVDQLIPLHPDGVTPELTDRGTLVYRVRGKPGERDRVLLDDEVFHIPGLSLNGYAGMSLMQYARESIGFALAAQGYTSRFLSQNARPGGLLKHPGKLTPQGKARLRAEWQELHAGVSNAWKTAVLEEGMSWQQTGMTNEDAQILGLIEWNIADLARWFNVPLHMIGETSKVTSWGSGIEQLSIGFVTYSLWPWLSNWEQTIKKDLIYRDKAFFAEFETSALLKGSTLDRFNAYAIAIKNKWMTPNEVRDRENMNPLDGGDRVVAEPPPPAPAAPETPEPADQGEEMMPPPPRRNADSRLREFATAAAGRVVRKEVVAIGRALKRNASDPLAFALEATAFYAEHLEFVADVMQIPMAIARTYVDRQREDVLAHHGEALERWESDAVDELVNLAIAKVGAPA